jgi:hypothetical protein
VLDNLSENTAITTTDDEDLLRVGVRVQGQMGNHLLVGKLVALSALDDVVEDQNVAIVGGLENEDILVLALLVVQHLLDLQRHRLACELTSVKVDRRRAVKGGCESYQATFRRSRGTSHLVK